VSHHTFAAWAYFPNGTFYRQIVHDEFTYEEYEDGGFACSIADNHLSWDPAEGIWTTSINAIPSSVEPNIPFAPDYDSVPGQISKDFFSRIDVPRGHSDGYLTFPWGLNITIQSVGTLKHTWSNKIMADTCQTCTNMDRAPSPAL
jgi:hypothetical protein